LFSFVWKSRYSVGVKDLDRQHQSIMQGLNELHEELMNGKINEAVVPLINNLAGLAAEHFATEERFMELSRFPGLAEHRASHQALSKRVGEFLARQETGDRAAFCQFLYFLREWMTTHMEKEDLKYAPWMAEHGVH